MSRSVDDLRASAMDIPGATRAQELGNQANTIVGSPEQMSDVRSARTGSRSFRGPPLVMDDLLTRPGVLRNISSATLPPMRGSRTSSRIRAFNSMAGSRSNASHFQSREWSVFGELYDAEDRTRDSASHVRSRHNKHRQTLNALRTYSPPRDIVTQGDTVQSPSEDPRFADTPPEHEEQEESGGDGPPFVSANGVSPSSRSLWQYLAALNPKFPTLSPIQRNIIKCSVAYFIASLFTFSPYFSGFIADLTNYGRGESYPAPSGHMVATVCVVMSFGVCICSSRPLTAPCTSTQQRLSAVCLRRTSTASWAFCLPHSYL